MKRVALVINTAGEPGRMYLRGVTRYLREHERWQVRLVPLAGGAGARTECGEVDGIVAQVDSPEVLARVLGCGVPVVVDRDIAGWGVERESRVGTFCWGAGSVVELAVEHLMERGIRRLAFCPSCDRGAPGQDIAMARLCEQRRIPFEVYRPAASTGMHPLGSNGHEPSGAELRRWLRALEKPVGILAGDDACGVELTEACRAENILVPDMVAVLGQGDDGLLCELSAPALSSIWLPAEEAAYWGAAYLDAMMEGRELPTAGAMPPYRVVLRGSTDAMSCDDAMVRKATQLIRDQVSSTGGVEELVRALGVSRRTLERRFMAAIGRTPGDELRRRRVQRAASLLERTDLSAAEIAAGCGFGAPARLTEAMRRELGMGPAEYRRRVKSGS